MALSITRSDPTHQHPCRHRGRNGSNSRYRGSWSLLLAACRCTLEELRLGWIELQSVGRHPLLQVTNAVWRTLL